MRDEEQAHSPAGRTPDPDELKARLEVGLAAREPIAPPAGGLTGYPFDRPGGESTGESALLSDALAEARSLADQITIDPKIRSSTPILGPLWAAMRSVVYRDLRLFAAAVAGKQMTFNLAVLRALEALASRRTVALSSAHVAAPAPGQEALERRVVELETRLAAVERELERARERDTRERG